ncbi:homoserine kinase [Telmatobacter bradus]|uniref:homoserine kinase n=1 Tax=Telmatobacter bradus TaxID=474953 RepID=UPI003B436783
MSEAHMLRPGALKLRLPATSANLGPGFDAAAIALDFALEIEATPAEAFSIAASGRNVEQCGQLKNNLILETYQRLLEREQKNLVPLALRMQNNIPLGMGCGSSAAGLVAAIQLANHYGQLNWDENQMLDEAYALEGHPDNVAACLLGGFVTCACEDSRIYAAQVEPPEEWRALVVLPTDPLSTQKARAVLPDCYNRADVVANIQSASLLGLAFATGDADLLRLAVRDRIHQPYRAAICPLLNPLLGLAGKNGILSASLSGAGPSVLVIVESERKLAEAEAAVRSTLSCNQQTEILASRFPSTGAATTSIP